MCLCIGVIFGVAFADDEGIVNGEVPCMNANPMPVPCQNFNYYTCISGCNWQKTIGTQSKSYCGLVATGCCQWREEIGRCIDGSCTDCPQVHVAVSFTQFIYLGECKSTGNSNGDKICRVPPPGG